MRVLVGFENSGTIREAFRIRGHDAWSCDLLNTEIPGNHYRCDIYEAFEQKEWDLIIIHPTCTKLCVSGNHVYAKGKPKYVERINALIYTMKLWEDAKYFGKRVCLENPVGVLSTLGKMGVRPQYIQPYEFGHPESKKTGLWLYNLPELKPTDILDKPKYFDSEGNILFEKWDNQTPSGQNKLGPSKDRWKIRSKTYEGIARAMADQWGGLK